MLAKFKAPASITLVTPAEAWAQLLHLERIPAFAEVTNLGFKPYSGSSQRTAFE